MLYIDFDLKRISVWHWKIHDLQLSNRAPGLYRERICYIVTRFFSVEYHNQALKVSFSF